MLSLSCKIQPPVNISLFQHGGSKLLLPPWSFSFRSLGGRKIQLLGEFPESIPNTCISNLKEINVNIHKSPTNLYAKVTFVWAAMNFTDPIHTIVIP